MNKLKGLWSWVGHVLTPLWKGAAKKVLHSQSRDLRARVKALINDDKDDSIRRVNEFFDARQADIVAGLKKLQFLPNSLAEILAKAVQEHGDAVQQKVVQAILDKGPQAVDFAFDGLEAKLDSIIDNA